MKIEKQIIVDGGPEEIWELLWDVERIAGCIRGTSDVRTIEPEQSYSAMVTQKVGPFAVSFPLAISVVDRRPPSSLTVAASGRDARLGSRMKATLELALAPADGDRTSLTIDATIALQGRLASLGQGIVARKADEELAAFSHALGAELAQVRGERRNG